LIHRSKANLPDLNAFPWTTRVLAWTGRYLLILTTLSLITMPVTQHLWTWDRLRGGRDFELGTLMVLSILCLALVVSKSYKQCIDLWLCARRFLAVRFHDFVAPEISVAGTFSNPRLAPPPQAALCTLDIPLQV
jgi:hypothetical protein